MQKSRLFVGNLLDSVSREDLEYEFSEFGVLKDVWVAQNPRGFAFVEYEDEDDANDAVSNMNGKEYFGSRIKVEVSRQRPSGRRGRGGISGLSNGRSSYDREGDGRRISRGSRDGYEGRGHDSYDSCDDNYHSSHPRKGHSSGGRSQPQFTRLYIGNLLEYVSCEELEDEFSIFGALKDVWVAQNYPFFAFVEYEDEDDAQDAISYMDGKEYFGSRIKVEVSRQRPSGRRGRGGSYAFSQPQFTRLYIGNILEDVSCEELEYEFSIFGALKDVWVAPNRSGFAFVEYEDEDDAKDAVSNMNGEEYFGSRIKVEVSRQRPSGRRGRGGSYAFSNGCGGSDREGGGRRISRGDHKGYGGRGHDGHDSDDSCDDNCHSTDHRKVHSGGGRRLAEDKKDEGNKYYKQRDYRRALCCYDEAIELYPCAAYYGNRAACYIMLQMFSQALQDARESVKYEPSFAKGHLRMGKCFLAMGDVAAAKTAFDKAKELKPTNTTIDAEIRTIDSLITIDQDLNKALEAQDYQKGLYYSERALEIAVFSQKYKVQKAESLTHLGRYKEAETIFNDILRSDSTDIDSLLVRGMCLYYQDNYDLAFCDFEQVLQLKPDYAKAREIYRKAKQLKTKKEKGKIAFKQGKLQEAIAIYTETLAIDPVNKLTNSKVYANRAACYIKLGMYSQALQDARESVKCEPSFAK
ncbi:hypothetical protein QYM36_013943, partial [Artemia franciscana]